MSFFGFDTTLPEHKGQQSQQQHQQQQRPGFATNDSTSFGHGFAAQNGGEEDDLAVYNWGEGAATNLLEGGDELNDETFGDVGDIGRDFQWSKPAPGAPPPKTAKPRGPIASTQSRYGPKTVHDPFAASEDDFYAPRPSKPKKPSVTAPKMAPVPASASTRPPQPQAPVRQPQGPPSSSMSQPMWGTAPRSAVRPPPVPAGRPGGAPPIGQIKSLEEIEAEMTAMDFEDARGPAAPPSLPTQPQVRSLEEIEREMMGDNEPVSFRQPPQEQPLPGLPSSGYAQQQALLDNMFPLPGQGQPPIGQRPPGFQGGPPPQPQNGHDQERLAREYHAKQERIANKIKAMSTYNNCMGSSDKDFITRIQLSQLATADPYTSDFYAQVFSAVQKSRNRVGEEADGPTVVKVGQDAGFGVGGASGNRFGQMGNKTMQKLSSQVKKLVEQRKNKQMSNDALQGALGRVQRTSVAGPKPVLAVPSAKSASVRMPQLNQEAGVHRQALTRKQALVAIEGLYDKILELEQARMEMPPPDAIPQLEAWNAECMAKGDEIWKRLMVMEPLDVSNPHPFVSLLNPIKGQKLFFRLQRHLQPQQAITLLTLLTATYSQLDVITRAPPPPVADASILSKVERKERAKREAETDNFLQYVVPGLDRIVTEQCGLGMINGLFGICFQRMEVWRVASTRPGVALFTALLSKAQLLVRSTVDVNPADVEHWNKTFAYLLSVLLPHLPALFPSSAAQRAAFGPGAYLLGNNVDKMSYDMERREAEVWGFAAALAVNAPDEEQTNLVGALRETILHTVQSARNSSTPPQQAELKLRNVNMFLNGLGLDAAMIE